MNALLVDDNADVRLLVHEILKAAGIRTLELPGGREVNDLLARYPVDIVILDVQMPDMDGWETLRLIRQSPQPDVPVIMCTVKSSPRDEVRGWELGCDGYLRKPFDIGELLEQVQSLYGMPMQKRLSLRSKNLEMARAGLEATATG